MILIKGVWVLLPWVIECWSIRAPRAKRPGFTGTPGIFTSAPWTNIGSREGKESWMSEALGFPASFQTEHLWIWIYYKNGLGCIRIRGKRRKQIKELRRKRMSLKTIDLNQPLHFYNGEAGSEFGRGLSSVTQMLCNRACTEIQMFQLPN